MISYLHCSNPRKSQLKPQTLFDNNPGLHFWYVRYLIVPIEGVLAQTLQLLNGLEPNEALDRLLIHPTFDPKWPFIKEKI